MLQRKIFIFKAIGMEALSAPKAVELESQPQRYDPERGVAQWNSGSVTIFVKYGELEAKILDPLQPVINIEAVYSLLLYDMIPDTVYLLKEDASSEEERWHEVVATDETQVIFNIKLSEYIRKKEEYLEIAGTRYQEALESLGLTYADAPDDYEGQNAFVDRVSAHAEIPDPHLYNVSLPELQQILPPSFLPDSLIIDMTENVKAINNQ